MRRVLAALIVLSLPAQSLPAAVFSAKAAPALIVPAAGIVPVSGIAPVAGAASLAPLAAPSLSVSPSLSIAPQVQAEAVSAQAALPSLENVGRVMAAEPGEARAEARDHSAAAQAFDGAGRTQEAAQPVFEPPVSKTPPPVEPPSGDNGGGDDKTPRRPNLSFPNAIKGALMAVDPAKSIYGAIKNVRHFDASREYWGKFKRGAEIDILSKGEDVFGRPTKITYAATKTIGQLTREDFKGTIPAHQLQAPIRQLRQALLDSLEEKRKSWNPNDPPITLKNTVRIVKFKSFIELYKEVNGKDSIPEVEAPTARVPLKAAPVGPLKALSLFLPRAVFLDLDLFDGPIPKQLLSDMSKLQRTGVYFVAFSRKPYAAIGSLRDKMIRQLSGYQLSTLLPIRFMAVTDNGSVILEFPRGGNVVPISVDAFSDAEMELLRDASQKASEVAGIPGRSVREQAQPPIKDVADEFAGFTRRAAPKTKDPQVRFEVTFPKNADAKALETWQAAFALQLKAQGLSVKSRLAERSFTAQKTDLAGSLGRLTAALGERFGLYLNPSDILVLSADPALKAANPNLDFGALTQLKGAELVENALGIMLGEHREDQAGDLSGSASRIASFTYDRTRYMSEFLLKQDGFEQNINFFSGHAIHSANDWLVWNLQNGRRPTVAEYEAHVRQRWDSGLREFKPVGLPQGEDMEGWLRESTRRGVSMYHMVLAAHDRGEILVGTEIPNFFMIKDFKKRSEELKHRYILHTIFDFIALRPDPKRPGHATLVIYDFKTGPAQSRQKLDKDVQVLTYAYFANQKWVGQQFPTPYLSGGKLTLHKGTAKQSPKQKAEDQFLWLELSAAEAKQVPYNLIARRDGKSFIKVPKLAEQVEDAGTDPVLGELAATPEAPGVTRDGKPFTIDAAKIEFIYNAVKQPTTVTAWDLETIRKKIISVLNRIHAGEQKLLGGEAKKKPAKKAAAKKPGKPKKKA